MGIVHPRSTSKANKLHFCNLELILNKTGYSHIMENKNIFFSFFNMGTGWTKFDPSSLNPIFSEPGTPPKNFWTENKVFHKGFNFWCFDGWIIVGGRPNPKLWGKYKKPHPRFHRFCYENPLKIDFFHKFITSICYFYILLFDSLISLWFWTETEKTNFEKKSNI